MFELNSSPQSPMSIWSRGVALGRASFRRLFALASLLGFISLLPTLYLAGKLGNTAVTPESLLRLFKQGDFIGYLLLLELLVIILSSLVNALIIRRIHAAAQVTLPEHELTFALRKLPVLVLSSILFGITMIIGIFIAALIGAILGAVLGAMLGHGVAIVVTQACVIAAALFIIVNLLFFQFAIVLDGKGPIGALNYSSALVFRNWWRTFLVLLITFIVVVVIAAAVILPFIHWLPFLESVDTGRTLLVKGVLRLVGAAVLSPFIAGILYVLYCDLRARHAQKTTSTVAVQA
ncbi:MAG: hypothetical protein ACRETA_09200 [Gammaproteobacteria bacterium]